MFRIGKYKENKHRPLKIKMRSQVAAEELITRSWKLASKEIYKKFWIRRDPNEEERVKLNELWNKAKKKKT